MTKTISALVLSLNAVGADVPEWLHLLPATSFTGVDGRGPFAAPDVPALIAKFQADGRKLAVDENHSIDTAGKAGLPSPARGWIVELQARADGLWGKVEWTEAGRALVAGKDYGYLSPVFMHTAGKPYRIVEVQRVALTNDPNLRDFLTSLHTRQETEMLDKLRQALGLPETATEAEALAAVASAHAANQAHVALMTQVRDAAGVTAAADDTALVQAIQSRGKATVTEAENAELKTLVTSLQGQVKTLATTAATDKATAAVEQALQDGKIVPALRDHMIARHMRNPQEVEDELKLMPSLHAGGLGKRNPAEGGGAVASDEDALIAAQMGLDPKAFAEHSKKLRGEDK